MGAREGRIVGGSLLAICLLMGDAPRAMEPEHPGAAASSAQEKSLPDFLDDERLPALQEAWRAREQAPDGLAQPQQNKVPKEVPRAETPAAPASGEAGSVRQRAEELSRRFGAEGATSNAVSKQTPPSVTIPPAVVPEAAADQRTQAVVKPDMPTRKGVMTRVKGAATRVDVGTTAALPTVPDAATKNALIGEKLRLAAPPPPSDDTPPLPMRAPKARSSDTAAPTSVKNAAVTRAKKPLPATSNNTEPTDPKAALRGSIMTNELGAFGWNSKPD